MCLPVLTAIGKFNYFATEVFFSREYHHFITGMMCHRSENANVMCDIFEKEMHVAVEEVCIKVNVCVARVQCHHLHGGSDSSEVVLGKRWETAYKLE